jgi:hypothetical protein
MLARVKIRQSFGVGASIVDESGLARAILGERADALTQ